MAVRNRIENIILTNNQYREGKEFWHRSLETLEGSVGFPVDCNGDVTQGSEIGEEHFTVDEEMSRRVSTSVNHSELGVNIVLLSAILYVLYRYSGQQTIVVGVPIHGTGMESRDCVNEIVPIVLVIQDDWTFKDLVTQVKSFWRQAQAHAHIPVHLIAESLQLPVENRTLKFVDVYVGQANQNRTCPHNHGMTFLIAVNDARIDVNVEYLSRRYGASTIHRIIGSVNAFLSRAIASPGECLSEFGMTTAMDLNRILNQFNPLAKAYPESLTVHEKFAEQVKLQSSNVAVTFGEANVTYEQLSNKANGITKRLLEHLVKPGQVIAVMMGRSVDMVAAILGVLKAGAAFLPIDPAFPESRIEYMLHDSEVRVLITDSTTSNLSSSPELIRADQVASLPSEELPNEPIVNSGDLAYVLYTSGSTGNPKGVMVEHTSVVNFFEGINEAIPFRQGDAVLAITTISFDIFLLETLYPLLYGLRVVMMPNTDYASPAVVGKHATEHGVTAIQMTPSRIRMLLSAADNELGWLRNIRIIMIGGESFPNDQMERLRNLTDARVFNMYGPTETTIWSTVKQVGEEETVTVGRPLMNTKAYIIDKTDNFLPIGVPGELCIAGKGVARGYWNNPELTSRKFISCPQIPTERMYKTGDRAKWLPNGEIQVIGRIDNQTKIRGYRVELGEIESALLKVNGVIKAAVIAAQQNHISYLCGYYQSSMPLASAVIREALASMLPSYMIPSFFIELKQFPLTPNGKLDKKQLPDPSASINSSSHDVESPENPLEERILQVWKRVLELDRIGVTQDFFDLGGNSILLIKLEVELSKNGLSVDAGDLSRHKTIRDIARSLATPPELAQSHKSVATSGSQRSEISTNSLDVVSNRAWLGVSLAGIEPFNDIFYKNCFYNSAFPIIIHYGKSIVPYLLNDIVVYSLEGKHLSMKYMPIRKIKDVLEHEGISVETKVICGDVVSDIKKALKRKKPVIVWIDGFYSSIRNDLYLKTHLPHTLLIYGYDEDQSLFHVIEHHHHDNLTYEKQTIPFDDVINSYEGFVARYLGTDDHSESFYEFELKHDIHLPKENRHAVKRYAMNYFSKELEIRQGWDHLHAFVQSLKPLVLDEQALKENVADLLPVLNDLVNGSKVKHYMEYSLFSEEYQDWSEQLMKAWISVRRIIVKFMYTQVYKQKEIASLIDHLNNIVQFEQGHFDFMRSLYHRFTEKGERLSEEETATDVTI